MSIEYMGSNYSKVEASEYRPPKPDEINDGRKTGGSEKLTNLDSPNHTSIDSKGDQKTEYASNNIYHKIAEIHKSEQRANNEEHPTPAEILAQLDEHTTAASIAHENPNSSAGSSGHVEGVNKEAQFA